MKKWFLSLDPMTKILVIAAGLIILWIIFAMIKKAVLKNRLQSIKEGSVKTGGSDVSGTPVTIDLGTKAVAIHGAFHSNDWFGLSEDEEAAIIELSAVPKALIPDLSAIYFKLYGVNMKEEFKKYLSTAQWQAIESKF